MVVNKCCKLFFLSIVTLIRKGEQFQYKRMSFLRLTDCVLFNGRNKVLNFKTLFFFLQYTNFSPTYFYNKR